MLPLTSCLHSNILLDDIHNIHIETEMACMRHMINEKDCKIKKHLEKVIGSLY